MFLQMCLTVWKIHEPLIKYCNTLFESFIQQVNMKETIIFLNVKDKIMLFGDSVTPTWILRLNFK